MIRLPAVRSLAALLLTFRLAVLPAEAAAPLKLLEKGVSKEALAGLVSDFEFDIFGSLIHLICGAAADVPADNAAGGAAASVRKRHQQGGAGRPGEQASGAHAIRHRLQQRRCWRFGWRFQWNLWLLQKPLTRGGAPVADLWSSLTCSSAGNDALHMIRVTNGAVVHPLQVLLEFPCELFSAVLAGRWAAGSTPFKPWMRGYWLRLAMAAAATTLVHGCFSPSQIQPLSSIVVKTRCCAYHCTCSHARAT